MLSGSTWGRLNWEWVCGVESGVESRVLQMLKLQALSKSAIAQAMGKAKPNRHLNELMSRLLASGLVAYTLPDKPNSRLQKYRLTDSGLERLLQGHTTETLR